MKKHPAAYGALLALLAAILFGASTPFVQRVSIDTSVWMTAAMLYAGAAVSGLLLSSNKQKEAAIQRSHLPRLLLMAICGAVVGPVALSWGLQHTSGMSASLMISLEAVFTVLLSALFYREHIDRHVGLAMALLSIGGGVLVFDRSANGAAEMLGLLAVMAATLAWAMDNTLSRALADIDPGRVILGKASMGAIGTLLIAFAIDDTSLTLYAGVWLFLIGASGYGLSLHFYLLAQRSLGAARTGSVFATAPFIGALVAFGLGERGVTLFMLGGGGLMLVGVVLHMLEQHDHPHEHEMLEHEHAHTHDDGHHTHSHDSEVIGAHSHRHSHDLITHSHPHTPDLHHIHKH